MAVSEKAINFIQGGLERGKAIPGQSLTNSPDQPYNWKSLQNIQTLEKLCCMFLKI